MDFEYEDIDDYCQTKPGSSEFEGGHSLGGKKRIFCYFSTGYDPYTLTVRSLHSVWQELEENYQIDDSVYLDSRSEGWKWVDLVLDEGVTWELIKSLIDESYQIALASSSNEQQLDLKVLTEELVDENGLKRKRKEVLKLLKPAVLLRTKKANESRLRLGQSKLGGRPDLPSKLVWPERDGKPLAFLAQINLNEVPVKPKLVGLPTHGILYFFSSFGWEEEDLLDPLVTEEEWGDGNTVVLYCDSRRPRLSRQKKPRNVNGFPAAQIEFETVRRLPQSCDDPAVTKLKLNSNNREKFESLFWDHSSELDDHLDDNPRNFLMGYADFEQGVDDAVTDNQLRLLLQIASDDCADMCWGDEGFLYFWIKPSHLSKANFANIFTSYQCG